MSRHALPPTDAELLAHIAKQDVQAFTALVGRYQSPFLGMALFHGLGRADGEEAVNDAFMKIWRSADKYVQQENVPAKFWLRSLMRYALLDKFRSIKATHENEQSATHFDESGEFDGDGFEVLADTEWTDMSVPEQNMLGLEKRDCFDGCLSELSAAHRKTLELLLVGGQSEDDIAAATGQSLGTVKSRKHYAVGKMQNCVAHCVDGSKGGANHG